MDKPNSKSTRKNYLHSKTDNRGLFVGGIVVLLIAITPFLLYAYESFPETQIWETSLFRLETSFPNWYSFAWYFTSKAIPLYLLLLWFFTCKHWWYHSILVSLSMYVFQIYSIFNYVIFSLIGISCSYRPHTQHTTRRSPALRTRARTHTHTHTHTLTPQQQYT